MSARDDILARVRAATQDIQEKDPAKDVPITWAYNQPTPLDDVLETFVENTPSSQPSGNLGRRRWWFPMGLQPHGWRRSPLGVLR